MVMRPLGIVALVIVLGAAGWYARGWMWPDESARVRAAVETLADTLTSASHARQGAGQLAVLGDLRNQLAADVALQAPQRALMIEGREQVLGLAAQVGTAQARLTLSFVDITVTLGADATTATVAATVQVAEATTDGSQSFDAQQVEMVWVRAGRSWILSSARAIDVLR